MDVESIFAVVIIGTLFAASMFAITRLLNQRQQLHPLKEISPRAHLVINLTVTFVFGYVMVLAGSSTVWVCGAGSLAALWLWFFVHRNPRKRKDER